MQRVSVSVGDDTSVVLFMKELVLVKSGCWC
jgi:hypothetical protein